MRFSFYLLILFFVCPLAASAASLLQPNDRIAICGDKITDQGGFSEYLSDYFLACQPVPNLDLSYFGTSPNAAAFLARINDRFIPYKPTVVLTNYGGTEDPAYYRHVQTEMVKALKQAGVRLIVIGSPRCADSTYYQESPAIAATHNHVLGELAEIDKEVAAKEGVLYADVYGATLAAMTKLKAQYGDTYVFDHDDVANPTAAEGMATAYAFLKALGFDGDIGTVTVDFAAAKAEATAGHKVVSYADNKLTMESSVYPFSLGAIPTMEANYDPFIRYLPFNEELNRFTLVVKNVPTPRARITWQDENHDFSAGELAKGVNLSATMGGHAFANSFQKMDHGIRVLGRLEKNAGQATLDGGMDPHADQDRQAALQKARNSVVPIQYTITIQPLADAGT